MSKKIELPKTKLSYELLEKRLSLNLSQREMAKEIGISYPTYAQVEKGTYALSLKILTKIAGYLEIDIKDAYSLYAEQEL